MKFLLGFAYRSQLGIAVSFFLIIQAKTLEEQGNPTLCEEYIISNRCILRFGIKGDLG